MFQIVGNTISITRGDTGEFTLDIQAQGQAYDYSNDVVLFTVKTSVYTKEHIIQKRIIYGENVVILPSDTEGKPYGDFYRYDIEITTAGGVVDTIIPPSTFAILPEVTFS